jgi:hypothetical protein
MRFDRLIPLSHRFEGDAEVIVCFGEIRPLPYDFAKMFDGFRRSPQFSQDAGQVAAKVRDFGTDLHGPEHQR